MLAISALALIASSCAEDPPPPPTSLIVTAPSMTLEYGDAIPALTPSYNASPETPATCTTTAVQSSAPGVYDVTCSGAAFNGQPVQYNDGAITIVRAPVTVTASSGSMIVGDEPPTITASYDGLKLAQTQPAVLATCSTDATSASSTGTYTTSCSGAEDDNYTFTYVNGTIEVAAALVTVTASSGSHTYGDDAPAISPQYSGFQHGETAPATDAVCESASDFSSPVGTYVSSCSGAADPNYSFVYVDGTVDVTPAALTITASSASMQTGAPAPAITPSYSGLVNGDTAPATAPTCSTTASSSSPAGTYPSSCSGAADTNYTITYVEGVVTISQSVTPVVVTASSATVTYGSAIPAITADYDGMAGTPSTPAVCTTTATQGSDAGTYPTTCSGANDPAHSFSYVGGTITIVPAAATVTASSGAMTYGGSVPAITASYSGLVNGESAPATAPTCSTNATPSSAAGSYVSTCSGAADDNYTFSYVDGTVTIDQAQVTVTASNATFDEGDAVPAITASYSGFLFGQTAPATAPTCSTNATSSSPAGTYASTCAGAADPNYTFSYVDGVVTVNAVDTGGEIEVTGYAGYSTQTVATTIAAGSNGATLPTSAINVASNTAFDDYSTLTMVSSNGPVNVFCKLPGGSNTTQFTSCSGGSGMLSTGAYVTSAAVSSFDVYTLFPGGAASLSPSSLTIVQDVPAAFRGIPASVVANGTNGLIKSLLSPAANGNFALTFGICDAGTPVFNESNPACHLGEINYAPGAVSTMGGQVSVSVLFITVTSNVYQKISTALTAPATVEQNDTFTVYAAPAPSAIPRLNPSSQGDATVNFVKDLTTIFPIPQGMEFVDATIMGGDAVTSGKVQFTYCPTANTPGCTANLTGDFDQTTLPYMKVSLPGVQVAGGGSMTVPTVAFRLKATGAPGTIANATLTQLNLTTNITVSIINDRDTVFQGYPTTGNADVKPPKAPPAILGSIEIVGAPGAAM